MTELPVPPAEAYGLVADIGGTNVRLAVVHAQDETARPRCPRRLSTKDHVDIVGAARAYLANIGLDAAPRAAVFAVAGPVTDEAVRLTNAGWSISARALRAGLRTENVHLVNDCEALVRAIPLLAMRDLLPIGSASPNLRAEGTYGIVAPGTGLGVAGLMHRNGTYQPLVGEGGHVAFAPLDATEGEVLRILTRQFGRVSVERIVSGPGLCNLHAALCEIEGMTPQKIAPETISRIARAEPNSFEARVFERFCAILGSFAADVALMLGARQGVLLAGGILPESGEVLATSGFRIRFEDKARFSDYVRAIPTALVVEQSASLLGAAAILRERMTNVLRERIDVF